MEMETIISNSPVTLIFKEVNGHADDEEDFVYDEASQEVKRNIDMDLKAKKAVSKIKRMPAPAHIPILPSQRITLLLSNTPIVGDLQAQLQHHRYGHALETRLLSTLPNTTGILQSID